MCASTRLTRHNEVPEKYQKVSKIQMWKKRDSISPRILKIGTNVLNLVYNCKNLKLVRQRKRDDMGERERAWARRVEWKTQSENHCTHHIDLTNKNAQPKTSEKLFDEIRRECDVPFGTSFSLPGQKKHTHEQQQTNDAHYIQNEENWEKIINFLFCATNQFSSINKNCE